MKSFYIKYKVLFNRLMPGSFTPNPQEMILRTVRDRPQVIESDLNY